MSPRGIQGLQWHWYHISPLHLLLFPLSLLFYLIVAARRLLFRCNILSSFKLPVPVIIVGNISVGGTGKTPLTIWLAEQLLANGWHPLIISRGFGGSGGNWPQEVLNSSDPTITGDEPVLMAQRKLCPVWIGRNRVAVARAALAAHPECDVVVSDDGLQHYRLQRDVEIAVIDGTRRFGNGLMLPAGPLREPTSRLKTVDAIVCNGGKPLPGEHMMQLEGMHFYNLLNPETTATATDFQSKSVHAIAGIGHPERYFQHLTKLGLNFQSRAYPDHHAYKAADLDYDDAHALLMTEKDAVKCIAFADEKCWALRVDAHIAPTLTQLILNKISH